MILGMNPKDLRKHRNWYVYLWQKKLHWALVLQPRGEAFQARIVDDFVHNAEHCYNAEVDSDRLFLVYEMLVENGEPYLMLSVKPDFDADRELVRPLGIVGPTSFEEVQRRAIRTLRGYRRYSFIGANCQHFAIEFAASLGTPNIDDLLPDDEAFVNGASDASAAVGAGAAIVGLTAAIGAAGAAMVSTAQPSAVVPMAPLVLKSVAMGATGVGLVGTLSLISVAVGYNTLHHVLREHPEGHCAVVCTSTPPRCDLPSSCLLLSPCAGVVSPRCSITLTPRGCGGTVGSASRWSPQLTDEPESEAAPACDEEPEHVRRTSLATSASEEPESEGWPSELARPLPRSRSQEAAMAAGGSRVAPWCSATSWEQL